MTAGLPLLLDADDFDRPTPVRASEVPTTRVSEDDRISLAVLLYCVSTTAYPDGVFLVEVRPHQPAPPPVALAQSTGAD